jgi:hypothetical protein
MQTGKQPPIFRSTSAATLLGLFNIGTLSYSQEFTFNWKHYELEKLAMMTVTYVMVTKVSKQDTGIVNAFLMSLLCSPILQDCNAWLNYWLKHHTHPRNQIKHDVNICSSYAVVWRANEEEVHVLKESYEQIFFFGENSIQTIMVFAYLFTHYKNAVKLLLKTGILKGRIKFPTQDTNVRTYKQK